MKKHAYLIMSHNEFPMLRKLLEALDDARADIFLHIDSKTKDVPIEVLSGSVCYSDLIYVDRSNISWGGGYSMVSATVNLLFTATQKNNYQYYHLLSGVDYPLKNNEEFFCFLIKMNANISALMKMGQIKIDTWIELSTTDFFLKNAGIA